MTRTDLGRIEEQLQGLWAQEAVELVDLEYLQENGRSVLRFYLDKAGGISIDDCAYMSDRIGAILDLQELVLGRYVLEVSSPGLDRRLKQEKDFIRFLGRRVKIRLKTPLDGRRNFSGSIRECSEGRLLVECGEDVFRLSVADIEEARLSPEVAI